MLCRVLKFIPGALEVRNGSGRNLTVMRRGRLFSSKAAAAHVNSSNPPSTSCLNSSLSKLFFDAYLRLCYSVRDMMPCQVLGVSHHVTVVEEGLVEVLVTAMVRRSSSAFLYALLDGHVTTRSHCLQVHNVIPIDLGSRRQSRSNSNTSITNRDHLPLSGPRQQQQYHHSDSVPIQHSASTGHGFDSSHSVDRERGVLTGASSADRERRRRTSSVGSSDSGPKGGDHHYDPYESAVYGKLNLTTPLRCLADKVLLTPLVDVPNAR